jgi:hypothetical protein
VSAASRSYDLERGRRGDVPTKDPSETGSIKTLQLSLDRIETGRAHTEIAVLLCDDGTPINVPRRFLPEGSRPGDVLALTLRRDPGMTRQIAEKTRKVQDELKASDPGGDIRL